jgi:hypothetical protein
MNHDTTGGSNAEMRRLRTGGIGAGVCILAAFLSMGTAQAQTPDSTAFAGNALMIGAGTAPAEADGTPAVSALAQNYPNPFNPTTQIQYSVEKAGTVSLKLYNLLGLELATLVAGRQEAGSYSMLFNASEHGHDLATGIYLYRLQIGSFVSVKKLAFIK